MWKILNKEQVANVGPIVLYKVLAKDPFDNQKTRAMVSLGGDSVVIIPKTEEGKFILGRQFRLDYEKEVLEFPNGGIEEGESPQKAAERELNEELGLEGEMANLGLFVPLVGLFDFKVHVFLCENVKEVETKLPANDYESIVPQEVSQVGLDNLIANGEIVEGFTLAAYQKYTLRNK